MMKSLDEVKQYLCDKGYEDAIVFVNPDFCKAFVDASEDGRAIYDYELMVESLMEDDEMDEIDAIEFIEYNTIRALPYMGPKAPIIKYPPEDDEE